MAGRRRRPQIRVKTRRVQLGGEGEETRGFSGGWNPAAPVQELAKNELGAPSLNVTLGQGNEAMVRLGATLATLTGTDAGGPVLIFWWEQQDITLIQVGAKLYDVAAGGTAFTLIHTFTTTHRAAICEFNGELVITHQADGVFTKVGGAGQGLTLRSATVKGNSIAAWGNKVWVTEGGGTKVWWSNLNNASVWTTGTDFNPIREVNDLPLSAIGAGIGVDVVGRGGLLVWKQRSMYRIHDAATGAYTTISRDAGAGGALSVTSVGSLIGFVGPAGFFTYSKDGELLRASDKVGPVVWDNTTTPKGASQMTNWIVWAMRDRFYVNVEIASGVYRTLELDPERKTWMPYNATGYWSVCRRVDPTTGLEAIRATHRSSAKLWTLDADTTTDDGAGFAATVVTAPARPNAGSKISFRQAVVHGRDGANASWALKPAIDWSLAGGSARTVELPATSATKPLDRKKMFSLGKGESLHLILELTTHASDASITPTGGRRVSPYAIAGVVVDAVVLS